MIANVVFVLRLLLLRTHGQRLTNVGPAQFDLEHTFHLAQQCRVRLGLHVLVCDIRARSRRGTKSQSRIRGDDSFDGV